MSSTILASLLFASLGSATLGWIMFLLSVFLILLVLVQRGKGGGLTGALGGPGGQSAFGSKAGDTFTVITAVSAVIWGFVCAVAMYTLGVPPMTASDEEFQFDDTPAAVGAAGDEATTGADSLSGLSGLSGLLDEGAAPAGDGEGSDSAGTPSAELTPAAPAEGDSDESSEAAESEAAESEAAESEAEVSETEPAESSDSAE